MFGTDIEEKKESKPLEKVQLKHLIIAFLILGVGCFLAFLVFLIEMISGKKVKEAQQGGDIDQKEKEKLKLHDTNIFWS